jgi:hypothetical protein
MKKIFLTLTLVAGFIATAQVKIGDNPTTIDPNSLLELETLNQGLLYPRVALTSTTSYAPLSDTLPNIKQPGMTVYNTATTTTGTNDVTPGLYVNDGFNWIRVTPTAPKTLYTDDSAITSTRTVTLNNNDLTFTAGVGGTGKTVVASTFKTGGAVYGNVRTLDTSNSGASGFDLTNNTVLLSSDYILILSKTTGQSITMPNPADNNGRILYLINNSTAAGAGNTYNFVGTYLPIPVTSIPTVRSQAYISNGSAWYKLNY